MHRTAPRLDGDASWNCALLSTLPWRQARRLDAGRNDGDGQQVSHRSEGPLLLCYLEVKNGDGMRRSKMRPSRSP